MTWNDHQDWVCDFIACKATVFLIFHLKHFFKGQYLYNISDTPIHPRAQVAQRVRQLDNLTTHTSLSPIQCGFAPGFVNYKKGCTRFAAASDKVYQLLVHGLWFSPDTPASSTTKTDRHDIAEILLKMALNTKKSNQLIFYL